MSSPLTTAQAIERAKWMISAAQKLSTAADAVTESRGRADRDASEQLKETQLLNYRVTTVPGALEPVLEALIKAAAGSGSVSTRDV